MTARELRVLVGCSGIAALITGAAAIGQMLWCC